MKTVKELKERKVALCDRASAIAQLAATENRDMTADESQEVDAILGVGDEGQANFKAGQVHQINREIARAEQLERLQAEMAVSRARKVGTDSTDIKPMDSALARQRHGHLAGFQNREEAFRSGCWLAANFIGHEKAKQYCRDFGIQNAMTGSSAANGGILVPEEMERSIIRLVEQYGIARQNVRIIPMGSDTLSFPTRTAGITSYYIGEVPTSITESSPTFRQNQLIAKKLAARTMISNDLIEDAMIDIANWVAQDTALEFARQEDVATFLGDGTSTYGGIVGLKNALAAGSVFTAATGNTSFATLDREDFENMLGQVPTYARPGAAWYISPVGYYASMARLMDAAGGNSMVDLGNGPELRFLGYPVRLSTLLNSTTTAQTSTTGLCYFGDLSQAVTMGIRRGMQTRILGERWADTDQTAIITIQRYDINVHERGTASVAGPVLAMATPGS